MIDKVEVRVPARVPCTAEFRRLYSESRGDCRHSRRSRCYRAVYDLRPYGCRSILHANCVYGSEGNHKLELIDTGRLTYVQMRSEIERVFDVDSGSLKLMRLDLAADIVGVPVSWFACHMHARWKRWECDIGKIHPVEYSQMGKKSIETFYLGKRPNCFRIYNKIAEFRHQYSQIQKRAAPDQEVPSFEDLFGYRSHGITVTRVERQIGGGRVPTQLGTFGKLQHAGSFNPFDRLEFSVGGKPEPQPGDYNSNIYLAGMGLRSLAEGQGAHGLRRFLNYHFNGHASRIVKRFRDFLPHDDGYEMDSVKLYELYRKSVERQLAA